MRRPSNLLYPFAASLTCLLVVLLFLFNSTDVGFRQNFGVGDLITLLTLISAIFGGFFAYKILITTIDQRDIGFMPFLYVLNLSISDSGIEINYKNYGQGPAIAVYWESRSSAFKFKERTPHPEVCRTNESTGLQREWLIGPMNISDFYFDLLCRDQAGNEYVFSYLFKNDSIKFIGTAKNHRRFI